MNEKNGALALDLKDRVQPKKIVIIYSPSCRYKPLRLFIHPQNTN